MGVTYSERLSIADASGYLTNDGVGVLSWSSGAAAGTLTGTTLAANVVASSLTSVGTLSNLALSGTFTVGAYARTLDTVTGDSTLTDTTVATDISVAADSTTTDASITTTYNFTGLSTVQGRVLTVHIKAVKGITTGTRSHTIVIKINGTEAVRSSTRSQVAAETVNASFILVYNPSSSSWVTSGVYSLDGSVKRPAWSFAGGNSIGIYGFGGTAARAVAGEAVVWGWNGTGLILYTSLIDTNSNELLKFSSVASAVNELTITNAATTNPARLEVSGETNASVYLGYKGTGGIYIGVAGGASKPTARLHLAAGTATASSAPLKFTSGTLLTAAEAGAIEFLTDDLYFTTTTGTIRKAIAFTSRLAIAAATATLTSASGTIIGCTYTATGTVGITLPAANAVPAGREFIIVDEGNNAGTNNITVTRAGADTFGDGSTSQTITTNLGVLRIYSDGTSKWFVY